MGWDSSRGMSSTLSNEHVQFLYLIPFYSISGIYVDSWNEMGQTPLFVAAFLKKLAIVKMLLNLHADPNIRVQGGFTPVHAGKSTLKKAVPHHLFIMQGRRKQLCRARNCVPNIWLDYNFHKLSEEKEFRNFVKN